MPAALRIRLFGEFSTALDYRSVSGLGSTRLQALLAYLVLNRDAAPSRQQLAFLFWPETTDGQAQTNLRQLLHTLRRRLPGIDDYLQIDERSIYWRPGAPVWFDIAAFEAAVDRARVNSGTERLAALDEASALARGELLPDCYDNWILFERERLTQQRLWVLQEGMQLLEERRDYPQAIEWARRLLAADPLHEATYRRLMRLHVLNNDRVAALRTYHTCAAQLEQELGVAPSAATREVYERLLSAPGGEPQSPSRESRLTLVGRQQEWATLQAAWRAANRGAVRCVFLSGEAGIGKTRLIEEVMIWAGQQGIPAGLARAYAAGGDLAYGALVDCLRSEAVAPLVRRLETPWRMELGRLLPELSVEDPTLPHPSPLTERWQVQRLLEALSRVFASPSRPFVLALDDMQWYAAETLEWLSFLVRFQPRARLLVIGAFRSDDIDPDHPLTRLLLDLRSAGLLAELPVAALSRPETAALASQVSSSRLDEDSILALHRFTEGNPLFVVETLRAAHPVAGMAPAMTPEGSGLPNLPPRIQSVIQTRLARLSPAAHDLAALAATIGRAFTFDVLLQASAQDEDPIARSLDELWQRRIVVEKGATAYDFSHDRIRDVAYAEINPARRRLFHRRVANALVGVQSADGGASSAVIAMHFQRAGDLQQAVVYYQAAAEAALRLFAYRDAIAMLEDGLAVARQLPGGLAERGLELELQMKVAAAWAAITSFLGTEAETAYLRALELCDLVGHTRHRFAVLWGLHEIKLYRVEYEESLALGLQCLDIATELGDVDLVLEGQHAVWGPYFFMGDYTHAFAHMQAGLALYDRAQHERLSIDFGVHDSASCALYEGALALWNMGLLDQAREREARSISLAHKLSLPANVADAFSYAALFYQLLADPLQVERFAAPALQISEEKGYPFTKILSAVPLGWSRARQGRMSEGLALALGGLNDARALDMRLHYSHLSAMTAEVLIAAGRHGEALALLEEAIDRFETQRDLICAADLWRLKAEALLALEAGRPAVEACLRTSLAQAQELGARVSALRAVTRLAQLQVEQGPAVGVREQLQELYSKFTEGHDTPDLAAAKAVLARLPASLSARSLHALT